MTSLCDAPYALSYTLALSDTNRLNRLVSEIFSIKVADRQTNKQTISDYYKGCLKLAAREPIISLFLPRLIGLAQYIIRERALNIL